MSSVPTWEALKKENQLRTQRKRVAVGEEEQSGLCSDVGCVDKKDARTGDKKTESKPSEAGSIRKGAATE